MRWLCGSNLDNVRVVFAGFIVGLAMFDGGCFDDIIPVSMVCGNIVWVLWYLLGFGVGCSGKALDMRSRVAGISSFLPHRSTLTRYLWLRRVSMPWPVVSHRRVLGRCIVTISPFWRGHKVCAVRLYRSMRWAFELGIAQCSGWTNSCIGG